MPVRAVCPECGATTTLDDDSPRKMVECRQCGTDVAVPGAGPTGGGPPPLPKKDGEAAAGFEVLDDADDEMDDRPRRAHRDGDSGDRPAVGSRDDEDVEDDRPRRPRGGRDDDDEDDDDRPRRRRDDDDDDEDYESSRRRSAVASREDDDEDDDEDERPRSRRADDEDDDGEEDDEAPRRRPAVDTRDEDEDDEDAPRPRPSVSSDDDQDDDEEDDDGRSIPRRRDDGSYGRSGQRGRPRAKSGKGGLIVAGLLAFVLLGAGGGAAAYYFWPKKEPSVAQNGDDQKPPDGGIVHNNNNPNGPNPAPLPTDLIVRPVSFPGDRVTVPLPGPAAEVCLAADGRFLLFHCPETRKLAVFDVSAARVVKELDTTGKDTLVAAGATRLILIDKASRTIRRYGLLGLGVEKEAPFPFEGAIKDISLGHGSNGPALVVGDGPAGEWPVRFLDLETLGRADVEWSKVPEPDLPRDLKFRASARGREWLGMAVGPDAKGVVQVKRNGKSVTAKKTSDVNPGYIAMTADGGSAYSRYGSLSNLDAGFSGKPTPEGEPYSLPSVCGPFYVTLAPGKGAPGTVGVSVTGQGNRQLGIAGPDIPSPDAPGSVLTRDRHLHFVPDARALVLLAPDGKQVEVIKLDVFAKVNRDLPFVFITSTPPDMVAPGSPFTYQVRALTNAKKVTYQLSGLPGATISESGLVKWDVPPGESRTEFMFSVRVFGDGERHMQNVLLTNAAAPAPKKKDPKVEPKPKDPKDPKSPEPKIPTVNLPPNVVPGVKLVQEASGKLPISPPELKESPVEVALPSPIRDACVAGGGRFLIFHCPTARKLAVFDVNTLKVEKSITVNGDEVLFAAGMEQLMVVYPDERFVIRYSLASFRPEADVTLDVRQKPTAAAMGSATAGPLILGGIPAQNNASKMALTFLDPDTLKEVWIEKAEGDFRVGFGAAAHLRASADGRTLGAWLAQLRPSGLQLARLSGNTIGGSYVADTVGHVTPGPDGQTVFTEKGMYTAKGEPTGRREPAVPAVHGNWFVTLAPAPKGASGAQRVSVWESGKADPLAVFDDLPGFDGKRDPFERDNPNLALDRRLFLVPEARLLVVVLPSANKLLVYRVGEGKK